MVANFLINIFSRFNFNVWNIMNQFQFVGYATQVRSYSYFVKRSISSRLFGYGIAHTYGVIKYSCFSNKRDYSTVFLDSILLSSRNFNF